MRKYKSKKIRTNEGAQQRIAPLTPGTAGLRCEAPGVEVCRCVHKVLLIEGRCTELFPLLSYYAWAGIKVHSAESSLEAASAYIWQAFCLLFLFHSQAINSHKHLQGTDFTPSSWAAVLRLRGDMAG